MSQAGLAIQRNTLIPTPVKSTVVNIATSFTKEMWQLNGCGYVAIKWVWLSIKFKVTHPLSKSWLQAGV